MPKRRVDDLRQSKVDNPCVVTAGVEIILEDVTTGTVEKVTIPRLPDDNSRPYRRRTSLSPPNVVNQLLGKSLNEVVGIRGPEGDWTAKIIAIAGCSKNPSLN